MIKDVMKQKGKGTEMASEKGGRWTDKDVNLLLEKRKRRIIISLATESREGSNAGAGDGRKTQRCVFPFGDVFFEVGFIDR